MRRDSHRKTNYYKLSFAEMHVLFGIGLTMHGFTFSAMMCSFLIWFLTQLFYRHNFTFSPWRRMWHFDWENCPRSRIEDRQTDRVYRITRLHAPDFAAAAGLGRATPHASPRWRAADKAGISRRRQVHRHWHRPAKQSYVRHTLFPRKDPREEIARIGRKDV